ncbi:conserved hypothetical protein [Aggregatibacter aphrophilus NJ8700]|nr:conserved hypothetical protein [Aggregatibacter aphrophilus NJ8700]PNL90213.1 hypothetical protein A6J76_008550 [Aggregatibacter aphrophilus]RDE86112.1 hypothetical protein DPW00_08660 [Aggregatibacter aphrophilus]
MAKFSAYLLFCPVKTFGKLRTIQSSSLVRSYGAVGKANVQNPLDFVTALTASNKVQLEAELF